MPTAEELLNNLELITNRCILTLSVIYKGRVKTTSYLGLGHDQTPLQQGQTYVEGR